MTCKLSSTAEHFHDDFNHRARNIIAIGHIVAPPSSASLEKMFKRELNQTNYLIVLINKRLIIQTTINYTTALLKSRAVLSEPILERFYVLTLRTDMINNV
ncbi:hypothetical protein AVI51_01770 [Piscirickettsia salmonis]|uniref:hypothetical protein n=1 Tax=Piscirickettsia salmonis TaxID=1238 RepID=UPI0006C76F62|nr:hypothetical protein [Piscirickettsia salmonis]APS45109.1 hypothetical protein AVI48_12480 [Piscirickettsia salmonis]APS48469.1 hypothetical protein AVI49_13090 [Piscirickettsia salmonis]APS49731.1 hypothetical protein AVI50_01815 [Piscirickettsia salmonis]APS52913.1 hypothetical protein AVI51_01770 [Piscirickettsia salmonis]